MEQNSSLVDLLENINPASQNLYNYLESQDIDRLSSTSKTTKSIINTYIRNNNNKFIRDIIYNIYFDSLCYLIDSLLTKYKMREDEDGGFMFSLEGGDVSLNFDSTDRGRRDISITVLNSSNNRDTINKVINYLAIFDNVIKRDEYDIDEDDKLYITMYKTLDLYYFTYFVKNFKIFDNKIIKLNYDSFTFYEYRNDEIFLKNEEIIEYYVNISNIFNPTKNELIKFISMININIDNNVLTSENDVLLDLAVKYNYLFKNKDVINFLRNVL